MLCSLTISNLAVVSQLELEFDSGLTVLTGETGAGKSILLTALGLALGNRATPDFIRPGHSRAEISLVFEVSEAPNVLDWLAENELDAAEQCIIRRVLSSDKRSRAFINNHPVPLQSLQTLSQMLIEIHGQHAHLNLLKSSEQLRLLDDSSGNHSLVKQVKAIYLDWHDARTKMEKALAAVDEQSAQETLLRYQIEELEQSGIEALDYNSVVEEHALQANLNTILATGQNQLAQLYENEHQSTHAILNQSIHALTELTSLSSEFDEVTELLTEAQIQVNESYVLLRDKLQRLEPDPQRLNLLEEQLATFQTLARKHHVKPGQLPSHINELKEALDAIQHDSEQLEVLRKAIQTSVEEYHIAAKELSKRREDSAQKLQQQVSEIIQQLDMPNGRFVIHLTQQIEGDPRPDGYESVEYRVNTNPGMPPGPLSKIASGGELSRIGLAIQVAATDSKRTPTMIFDEVDSGIGGGTAEIVGKQLRTLSSEKQVLCVTHLAQVAAQAHQHLLVEKISTDDSTRSSVRLLAQEERRDETARMLGGVIITEQTLAYADEMLRTAND